MSHKKIAQLMKETGFSVETLLGTYPKVKKYLLHDVVGLLAAEVMVG